MRQKWQVFSAFLAQKNKCVGRRQGEKLCIISMCHFLPPLVVVMHYNAPHATHPPCMWGSMQIWHGSGRNGVTDVRVGSCATAACTTNATAALFTYRSQEGRRATGKIGIGFPPASSSLYKPACLLSNTTFRPAPCMRCSSQSCFMFSKFSWLSIYLQLDEQFGAVCDGHLLAHPDHQARVGPVLVRGHAQRCRHHHCQTHKLPHFDC